MPTEFLRETTSYTSNYLTGFQMYARNIETGEERVLHTYAQDATGAYAQAFRHLDRQAGNRAWCIDGFAVTSEPFDGLVR